VKTDSQAHESGVADKDGVGCDQKTHDTDAESASPIRENRTAKQRRRHQHGDERPSKFRSAETVTDREGEIHRDRNHRNFVGQLDPPPGVGFGNERRAHAA